MTAPDPRREREERFPTLMRQDWRDLLFLHWRADRAALQALVPAPLEVETCDGSAWVGLIPFRVERVRPPGLPPPPLVSSFGEVNVRTYVRHPSGVSGVWFFSLDAGSRLAVLGARAGYRLPYFSAAIRVQRQSRTVHFESRRRGRAGHCIASWRPTGADPAPARPGSLDELLVERYVLFAGEAGRLWRARVAHEPYPLQGAELTRLDQDLVQVAGIEVSGEPLVHASPGVDVRVSPPDRPGER